MAVLVTIDSTPRPPQVNLMRIAACIVFASQPLPCKPVWMRLAARPAGHGRRAFCGTSASRTAKVWIVAEAPRWLPFRGRLPAMNPYRHDRSRMPSGHSASMPSLGLHQHNFLRLHHLGKKLKKVLKAIVLSVDGAPSNRSEKKHILQAKRKGRLYVTNQTSRNHLQASLAASDFFTLEQKLKYIVIRNYLYI
jgi:hypothetical protein